MATIKGQDLRIFVDSKVVAAATSSTIHVAATVESTTTKDSPDDWEQSECTGKSWDASVDALVVLGVGFTNTTKKTGTISYQNAQWNKFIVTVPAGETVLFETETPLYLWNGTSQTGLANPYTNRTANAVEITVLSNADNNLETLDYVFGDAQNLKTLFQKFNSGNTVSVQFSSVEGYNNRVEAETYAAGEAYITDISVTAQNKATGTYSITLQGVGELVTNF